MNMIALILLAVSVSIGVVFDNKPRVFWGMLAVVLIETIGICGQATSMLSYKSIGILLLSITFFLINYAIYFCVFREDKERIKR